MQIYVTMQNENAVAVILQCIERRLTILLINALCMREESSHAKKNDSQSAFFSSSDH